jgi:putative acetyltransferase
MNEERPRIVLRRLDPHDPAALRLLRLSDELMESLYPPESNHPESIDGLAAANVLFAGAYVGRGLAGCGAAKLCRDDGVYGEIKRLFVDPAHRGQGVGAAILEHLEAHLCDAAVTLARLETGIRQPEALRLYRRFGYRERPPFGDYRADPLSVFMEKRL